MKSAFSYEWETSTFTLAGQSLRIRAARRFDRLADTSEQLPFGSTLWPAAVALSEALVRESALVEGKEVLELGCGLGLVSVVAAKLGGKVTASDGHSDMNEALAHNAALNQVTIDYIAYDWAHGNAPPPFPVVLASDVLYETQACTLLADALVKTLAPGGIALVSDPGRPHWPRFLRKLEARELKFRDARVKITSQVALLAWHPTAARAHHLLRIEKA